MQTEVVWNALQLNPRSHTQYPISVIFFFTIQKEAYLLEKDMDTVTDDNLI